MNLDAHIIEKKILSLKTQYNRELNKLKTKSELGEDEITYWYAFEHLHFLKDVKLPQPNTDPLLIIQTENKLEEDNITDKNENEQKPILSFTQRQSQPRCTLKRKYDTQLSTLNLLQDASNANINKQEKDEFSIFGETIAKT
ncbi:unnamed protein product [Parnassius apollo]|uniref:(apollo) hypothetical protein n=1 Tax=Parnassius apollo TaxID=110799 RepID=A0A8S3YBR8_PARAO|nr:unnamed protein product [Parnassius apollo]